jgi:hypothetical protein
MTAIDIGREEELEVRTKSNVGFSNTAIIDIGRGRGRGESGRERASERGAPATKHETLGE